MSECLFLTSPSLLVNSGRESAKHWWKLQPSLCAPVFEWHQAPGQELYCCHCCLFPVSSSTSEEEEEEGATPHSHWFLLYYCRGVEGSLAQQAKAWSGQGCNIKLMSSQRNTFLGMLFNVSQEYPKITPMLLYSMPWHCRAYDDISSFNLNAFPSNTFYNWVWP